MSLDKAIKHGKEKRKPYRGAKAIDPMCRNHGGCPACAKKRQYKIKRREPLEEEERREKMSYDVSIRLIPKGSNNPISIYGNCKKSPFL